MTSVPPKFRVYILEYMAHLSLKDWAAVGDDFVKLGFVADGSKNPNEIPGLMDSVGVLLDVLMAGGGAKNLNVVKVRTTKCSAHLRSFLCCHSCARLAQASTLRTGLHRQAMSRAPSHAARVRMRIVVVYLWPAAPARVASTHCMRVLPVAVMRGEGCLRLTCLGPAPDALC